MMFVSLLKLHTQLAQMLCSSLTDILKVAVFCRIAVATLKQFSLLVWREWTQQWLILSPPNRPAHTYSMGSPTLYVCIHAHTLKHTHTQSHKIITTSSHTENHHESFHVRSCLCIHLFLAEGGLYYSLLCLHIKKLLTVYDIRHTWGMKAIMSTYAVLLSKLWLTASLGCMPELAQESQQTGNLAASSQELNEGSDPSHRWSRS